MASDEPGFGPLQLLVVGFETTELLQGQIAREIAELRGRGLVRVVDARMFTRSEDGELGEVDLNPLLGDPRWRPAAHLFGLNGAATNGGSGGLDAAAFAATAGFTLEDLRRLTDEIHHGEHAAVVLVEHLWAGRLREKIRAAGGRLIAQGMLTQEVLMLVGAELQATADAGPRSTSPRPPAARRCSTPCTRSRPARPTRTWPPASAPRPPARSCARSSTRA
jgi:uncharacterized membrane protein